MRIEPKYLAIGLCSTYFLTSAFFFIFPSILRRKKIYKNKLFNDALQGKIMIRIAHRGGTRIGTQNTIQAFKRSLHVTDCIEMDLCETLDKKLVVHHDKHLVRSCDVDKNVSQMNYSQLPKYQDSLLLDFTSEPQFFPTNNEKIPLFEQILQLFSGTCINVELKTPTPSAIDNVINMIREYDRENDIILGIRTKENIQIRKKCPDILTFMNDFTVGKMYLSYFTGLLPFIKFQEASFQTPVYSEQFENWFVNRARNNNKSELVAKIGCKMLKVINYLSIPLIWHLKKRGIMTYGWVCNTEQSFQRAKAMGVQGIMSDQPFLLDKKVKQWAEFNK